MSERNPDSGQPFTPEQVNALVEGLNAYADPKHWAIRRNGTPHPDCIWIGPGSLDGVPNGPFMARSALAYLQAARARG